MIEIVRHLFVGNELDYENYVKRQQGWAVLHAAKEPYHRRAVGYTGRSCDAADPEYLMAYRERDTRPEMCLNMIDAPKPQFFQEMMINAALGFINLAVIEHQKDTLVHCNQGGSRAPSLVLLYLRKFTDHFDDMSFEEAEDVFRAMYPLYLPATGIRAYVAMHW